jgi:hypothetical protein
MAGTPEANLVARIRDDLTRKMPGAVILKIHGSPFQFGGVPDLLVFYHGRAYALEVKCCRPRESDAAARDRTTALQREMIRKLRATGVRADVVLSPAEAWAVVSQGTMHLHLEEAS